jgi:hypothetical protein
MFTSVAIRNLRFLGAGLLCEHSCTITFEKRPFDQIVLSYQSMLSHLALST